MRAERKVADLVFNEVGVMEDDEPTRRAMVRILKRFGFRVAVADSEDSVVELARRGHTRSYILDCHMGSGRSGEGLTALERLKKHDSGIFVGILTGYQQSYQEARNMRLANVVLMKSADREADVRRILAALLDHAKDDVEKTGQAGPSRHGKRRPLRTSRKRV